MNRHPSEVHKDLTAERINEVGRILAKARFDNLEAVDEERDSGWSIGCRAHAWCCSELVNQSYNIPYLTIKNPSLRFIFKIGQVEVSFYRGETGKPKKNICSRAQTFPELRQLGLFKDVAVPDKLVWTYAIETDLEGKTTNIEFLGMGESGDVFASHIVPIHQVGAVIMPISESESAPVELPSAAVSLSIGSDEKAKETNEKGRNISGR
ncbi:hypothetical protein P3339_08050 [Microbulbifer sp. MLAF003]|uniref:hypothetical protein n=1 Tax=Microbulbifer sp. MLAF003 TaxID=3032582 RepID=UPI0024AD6245|nr:hypothetical protein [Microbulbifer sp. MLAF003]WHI52700.1 hypothetical protein P3339_08050 [Microbulbifer sp. MLAF003]